MSVTAGPDSGHLRHPCGPGDLVGALLLAGASDTSSRSNSPNVRPLAAPASEAQAAALEQLPPAQAAAHAPAAMVVGPCSTPPQHSLAVAAALAAAGIPHHLHKHLLMAAAAAAATNGANGTPCPFPQQQQHSLGAGAAARAPAAMVALQSHQQQQPCSSSTPAGSCPTTCDERAEQVLLAAEEEEEEEEAAGGCGAAPLLPPIPAGHPRAWLYHLVTCQWLFKPCPACRNNHAGREVLMTFFDIDAPEHGYCTYCPGRMGRRNLLQIRRSTYHEVIKAADICRAADISGVQHYVINGSKVLFLRPRPQPRPPKGVVAPARCKVDGRQLMDHGSCYCSLRCKLEVEDPDFAANFPHDALMAADAAVDAAAQAGGSGLAAMGTGSSSGGEQGAGPAAGQLLPQHPHLAAGGGHYHQLPRARAVGGMAVVGSKRSAAAAAAAAAAEAPLAPRKRTASALAAAAAACEEAEGQVVGAWGARSKRQRSAPSKFAKGAAGGLGGSPCHHHHHEGASAGAGVLAVFKSGGRPGGAQSPAHSGDSTRSTTCHCRWAHRRKGEPVRSPLQ